MVFKLTSQLNKSLIFITLQLKGLLLSDARNKAEEIITKLNLQIKKNDSIDSLSGGMQRKLHLGTSLIGEPKVILCSKYKHFLNSFHTFQILLMDEPTLGLDQPSRLNFFEYVSSFKKNRIIIFSTHLVEEADIFGDKVAFIRNGELIRFGTPKLLKKEYGN